MKDLLLKKYNVLVRQLWESFTKVQLVQIPRKKNTRADELSKLDPSDLKAIVGILVEYINQPSIANEPEVMAIDAPD